MWLVDSKASVQYRRHFKKHFHRFQSLCHNKSEHVNRERGGHSERWSSLQYFAVIKTLKSPVGKQAEFGGKERQEQKRRVTTQNQTEWSFTSHASWRDLSVM